MARRGKRTIAEVLLKIPIGHQLANPSTTKTSQSQKSPIFTAAFAAHGEQTVSVNCTPVSKWKPRSSRKPVAFVEPGLYSKSKYFLSVAP